MKRLALLTAVLALSLPAQAAAADYRGKTSQGLKVSALVKDGRLKLLKISWRVSCTDGVTMSNRTDWQDRPEGPIEHEGSRFTDSGLVEGKFREGGRFSTKLKLFGEFSDSVVTGKMTIRGRVHDSAGRAYNCRGTIRFKIPKV